MKKIGRVGNMWLQVRRQWITQNPGPWFCHYCRIRLEEGELTLDHYLSRSRRPDLRYDDNNLVPCCELCNRDKGSLSGDEYLEKLSKKEK